MALPSSGQISIKNIFDEGTSGGCYEGGSGYSLGALADAFGIGGNPDSMSEFYGLSCPVTVYSYNLYYSDVDCSTACNDGTFTTVYTTCSPLALDCNLYDNSALNIPVAGGYYSDGSNCYTVIPSKVRSYIGGISSCSATYNVTIYSRAGDFLSGPEYNVYYSQDGSNWTYLAGPLSSILCTELSTVSISSGIIYLKAERDIGGTPIYIVGANSSSCPGNLADTCQYSALVGSNMSIAITAAVSGGDFFDCF